MVYIGKCDGPHYQLHYPVVGKHMPNHFESTKNKLVQLTYREQVNVM